MKSQHDWLCFHGVFTPALMSWAKGKHEKSGGFNQGNSEILGNLKVDKFNYHKYPEYLNEHKADNEGNMQCIDKSESRELVSRRTLGIRQGYYEQFTHIRVE